LNQVVAQYASGFYQEIIVTGNQLQAKKFPKENIVNGKKIVSRDIDRTNIPENLEITDIGISDPKNPTKITIETNNWSRALWDILPSI